MSRGAGSDHGAARRKRPAGLDDAEDRLLLLEDAPRRVQIGPSLEARERSALRLRRHGELRPEPERSEREAAATPTWRRMAVSARRRRTTTGRCSTACGACADPLRDVTHVRGISLAPSTALEVGTEHALLELRELAVELE